MFNPPALYTYRHNVSTGRGVGCFHARTRRATLLFEARHARERSSSKHRSHDGTSTASTASTASNASTASSVHVHLDPQACYTYKTLRALFTTEQLKDELRARDLPYLGYKTQLAGRLYQALLDEGRGLVGEEAARVDAALLTNSDVSGSDHDGPAGGFEETFSGVHLENDSEAVMSNKTGMQVVFLSGMGGGGGSVPGSQSTSRSGVLHSSVGLRTLQSVILFDVGEDTQRSLIGHTLVDWKRIDRIFISSMDPESVLGLPGMLCTISASRSKGHEAADVPVHVYGPPGLVQFVSSMLAVSRTYLEMPVVLHELTPGPVPEEGMEITEVLKRSRLYACKLPPDALNRRGWYDGELKSMLKRHKNSMVGSSTRASDLRAGTLEQALPGPGDPERKDVSVLEMVWTIRVDSEWVIKASPLKNSIPCFGFLAIESDRSGRLYPTVAQALGVFDSKQFSELKSGRSVLNEEGIEVRPEACVGPNRKGRTVGIVPSCVSSTSFATNMVAADVLIHGIMPSSSTGYVHLGKEAGACAKALGAKELVLWQAQTRFLDMDEADAEALMDEVHDEASAIVGEDVDVVVGGSFCAHQWVSQIDDERPVQCPEELWHLL